MVGIVWDTEVPEPKNIKIKKIISKINFPKLSEQNIEFIKKFSQYNLSNLGMTLKLFLYEKGLVSLNKKKTNENLDEYCIAKIKSENLSAVQKDALKEICQQLKFSKYSTTLLHGVTGSGKTLVYFEVIKKALEQNQQALVLLP